MKAALIRAYGPPEVISIEDVPVPAVAADEVLIRVAASSFNPADAAIRSGALKDMLPVAFPYVLGADAAGVVERVGTAVEQFSAGDRVFAYVDFLHRGGQAELVVVKAAEVAMAPRGLSLVDAAVLPAAGSTAWQALFVHADIKPGQRVLITGASGGVGSLAVQLARWKGAVVVASASAKHEWRLRGLGVSEFVDYAQGDVGARLAQPVDAVIDCSPAPASDVTALLSALRPGGVLVALKFPANPDQAARRGVRAVRMASQRKAAHLLGLAQCVEAGALKPILAGRRPLTDVVEVHREGGPHGGKLALIVDPSIGG